MNEDLLDLINYQAEGGEVEQLGKGCIAPWSDFEAPWDPNRFDYRKKKESKLLYYFWDSERPKMPYVAYDGGEEEINGKYYFISNNGVTRDQWQHRELVTQGVDGIEWRGGDCPVDGKTLVAFENRGGKFGASNANCGYWANKGKPTDIIRFWVLKR